MKRWKISYKHSATTDLGPPLVSPLRMKKRLYRRITCEGCMQTGPQSDVFMTIWFLSANHIGIRSVCQQISDHDKLQQIRLPPVNQTLIKERNVWLISAGSCCYLRSYPPLHQTKLSGWVWANALQYDSHYSHRQPAGLQSSFLFSFKSRLSRLPLTLLS